MQEAEYEDMRGDSLPGGSEMEFEARGLPARPHQPQAQPQTQPQNQAPQEDPHQQQPQHWEPQGSASKPSKEQDVSSARRRDDYSSPSQLINVDINGVRGDSPAHGTLVDLDARSYPYPAHDVSVPRNESGSVKLTFSSSTSTSMVFEATVPFTAL